MAAWKDFIFLEIKAPFLSTISLLNNENFFALRIANYILGGGGFQSRLYKNIREKKGLVYSIYSHISLINCEL